MCWEDVKIHRRQYVNSSTPLTMDNVTFVTFLPNYYRQKVIISVTYDASLAVAPPVLNIFRTIDGTGTSVFTQSLIKEYVMDISDWGEFLQGGFSITAFDGGIFAIATLTEICLNDPKENGVPN